MTKVDNCQYYVEGVVTGRYFKSFILTIYKVPDYISEEILYSNVDFYQELKYVKQFESQHSASGSYNYICKQLESLPRNAFLNLSINFAFTFLPVLKNHFGAGHRFNKWGYIPSHHDSYAHPEYLNWDEAPRLCKEMINAKLSNEYICETLKISPFLVNIYRKKVRPK